MFIDQATIRVKAGDGGDGCVAFRREKFVPKGGPCGGDGGTGGSVSIVATRRLNTLYHLQFQREFKAGRGQHGMGSNCSGHDGADVTIELPVGSVVRDKATDEVIADLTEEGQRVTVAQGGRGGWGDHDLATAKPPLSSFIGAANPRIADYPSTTLAPTLGVVRADDDETFVVADIPGLIEGAHEGHGLGDQFLRHVERCAVLVHLVDLSANETPEHDAEVIAKELEAYAETLAKKPRIVCGSKLDSAVPGNSEKLRAYAVSQGYEYQEISAVTGEHVRELVRMLARVVRANRAPEPVCT